MKKFTLIIVLYLTGITYTFSQDLAFGIRGGVNNYAIGDMYSRGGSFQSGHPNELFSPNKEFGYQLGVYTTITFGKFFIRPEFNYASFKNSYDFTLKKSYWKRSRIDVPVSFGYTIFKPLSVYVGPGFNFYKDATLDGVQVTSFSDGGPDLENTNVSINVGLMVNFGRIGVDLRYEIYTNKAEEELLDIIHSAYGVNLVDHRAYTPSVISLSIFFDLLKTDEDGVSNLFSGLFRSNRCYCPYP